MKSSYYIVKLFIEINKQSCGQGQKISIITPKNTKSV